MKTNISEIKEIMEILGIRSINESVCTGTSWISAVGVKGFNVYSPVNGKLIGNVIPASETEYEAVLKRSRDAFEFWKKIPAPKRGDIIRQIGNRFREFKEELGFIISYEMGKSLQEGFGEVQEMIDICDFATGLSRQLYGHSMHSERPQHRMYEQWHPIGSVGIITSFNFPVAVWSWNAMIAAVCGNTCIWKPSEKAPLSAVATMNLMKEVLLENNLPEGIFTLINGKRDIGEKLVTDKRIKLISATGSTKMGKSVGTLVANRLSRCLLELGGNNAMIISDKADLSLAINALVFSATGTAGQRCTTTRRVIVHQKIFSKFLKELIAAYGQLKIGSPLDEKNHIGPLIDSHAVRLFEHAIEEAIEHDCKVLFGGKVLKGKEYQSGCYVQPTIIEAPNHLPVVQRETFAPILYLMKYQQLEEALAMQNDVPQGLSSSIFTKDLQEAEIFLSHSGSDCGIANVNIGTSGAEIGGAFGGEKETGGGRESGSDAWKVYMRRQTVTINFGNEIPLAQGVKFEL